MPRRERLFCGYDTNTNDTGGAQNQWYEFSYPSSGIQIWRQEGEGKLTVDPARVAFTWTGEPTYFKVDSICNVIKPTPGSASRTIEFCWFKNANEQYGITRQSHMNASDSQIISGSGYILFNTGDTYYPMVRNTENNELIRLFNCTFCLTESSGW